jgi:hypothetical protein
MPAHRRDPLERLIRYTARGAVALERLAQDDDGGLPYRVTRVGLDGTRGSQLSPLERLEKRAALVPPPWVHQVRDAGGWAAPRNLRGAIPPTRRQHGIEVPTRPASSRGRWARRLKRVLSLDLERGPRGPPGAWRLIAAIPSVLLIRPTARAPRMGAGRIATGRV